MLRQLGVGPGEVGGVAGQVLAVPGDVEEVEVDWRDAGRGRCGGQGAVRLVGEPGGLVEVVLGVPQLAEGGVVEVEGVGGVALAAAGGELPPPLGVVGVPAEVEKGGEDEGALGVAGEAQSVEVFGSVVLVDDAGGEGTQVAFGVLLEGEDLFLVLGLFGRVRRVVLLGRGLLLEGGDLRGDAAAAGLRVVAGEACVGGGGVCQVVEFGVHRSTPRRILRRRAA
ncbi:hypothetical protein BOQ63_000045 (plasmid) [Streptomyces viridifaciens]|nr:hypothetical protein BOQ63_000045 [Streptomyces viridifaciens]